MCPFSEQNPSFYQVDSVDGDNVQSEDPSYCDRRKKDEHVAGSFVSSRKLKIEVRENDNIGHAKDCEQKLNGFRCERVDVGEYLTASRRLSLLDETVAGAQ